MEGSRELIIWLCSAERLGKTSNNNNNNAPDMSRYVRATAGGGEGTK